jgi:hypothetical protein
MSNPSEIVLIIAQMGEDDQAAEAVGHCQSFGYEV